MPGAVAAVVGRRKSLLPAGITAFYGDFESGDVVDLLGPDRRVVARGFVGHDAAELPGIIGRSLAELPAELRHPVVHADDLVAVPQTNGVPVTGAGASDYGSVRDEGVQHVGR